MNNKYKNLIQKRIVSFEYEGETHYFKSPTNKHKVQLIKPSKSGDEAEILRVMSAIIIDLLCDEKGTLAFDKTNPKDCEAWDNIDMNFLSKCIEAVSEEMGGGAENAENFSN